MKRLALAAVLAGVACTAAFATSGTISTLSASASRPDPLYITEQERLVSAIAGSILNIAAFADRFEQGDSFRVRRVLPAAGPARFKVARRAEVFTVEVADHVWSPKSYGRLARSFMADGAGLSISEDPARDRTDVSVLVDPTPKELRAQNVRLSQLLEEHPRSASIHERAALLLAAAARRESAEGRDARGLLCRMTAHLAVARALHDGVLSRDGEMAERMLSGLAVAAAPATTAETGQIDGPVTFGGRPHVEIVPGDAAGGGSDR